jgi:hypothetical protein
MANSEASRGKFFIFVPEKLVDIDAESNSLPPLDDRGIGRITHRLESFDAMNKISLQTLICVSPSTGTETKGDLSPVRNSTPRWSTAFAPSRCPGDARVVRNDAHLPRAAPTPHPYPGTTYPTCFNE